MTKNHKAHCDKSKIFRNNLSRKNYGSFADFCLDVTEHFAKEGVPVKYLSPINEPVRKWTGGQEGCHYYAVSAGKLARVFAEKMNGREGLKDVKLSGFENGDIRWFNKLFTYEFMKYPEVRRKSDGIDIHSYFLNPVNLPFLDRVSFLKRYRKFLDFFCPGTDVNMSEWCHMKNGRDKGMDSALVMANVMYEDLSVLNVNTWQHWIALSEVDYCDGLIYINLGGRTFEMTKRYYATGNFSKYIPEHAVRVAAECDDSELKILAFEKDAEIVIIIINNSCLKKHVSLPSDIKIKKFVVTDEKLNLKEFEYSGRDISVTGKSVNTVVCEK